VLRVNNVCGFAYLPDLLFDDGLRRTGAEVGLVDPYPPDSVDLEGGVCPRGQVEVEFLSSLFGPGHPVDLVVQLYERLLCLVVVDLLFALLVGSCPDEQDSERADRYQPDQQYEPYYGRLSPV